MGLNLFLIGVVLLALLAIFDLIVGVANDAVNFLSSSIGSRVAPRFVILIVASLGILAGVSFSSGMMEVARKGIFHPQLFTMPELMALFLAVMLADVVLLDIFNSFGLPTSTTVSIVFELLGAAVVISIMKIARAGESLARLADYINTDRAMLIILGILLSVVIAFACGALAQVASRLLFTFEYKKRLKRYGALWGGVAMASISYFIFVKGVKGTSFTTPEAVDWIQTHTFLILISIFAVSAVLLQGLLALGFNILKPIVLIGTFALALAFAANDLVNFIGVPMAGYHAYKVASASTDPTGISMSALGENVPSEVFLLLAAGAIMVITLWISRKARSVAETQINLGHHETDREERFESSFLSRVIVRMAVSLFGIVWGIVPAIVRRRLGHRLQTIESIDADDPTRPPFDLLRAGVNLMVAGAVISYATSYKLPLSTTYITFMVAMGTSFADMAWGRESAVYRVTGVLTVIGGWFMTGLMAVLISGSFAFVIFWLKGYGVLGVLVLVGYVLWRNHVRHGKRAKSAEAEEVFTLKKVADVRETVSITFEQMGRLLQEIRQSLDSALEGLFAENVDRLGAEAARARKIQRWANIITANVFKALRLVQREALATSYRYAQTGRRLQKLADGHRDIVVRSHRHVANHHKGLLPVQIEELKEVKGLLHEILLEVESTIKNLRSNSHHAITEKENRLRKLAERLNERQIERIRDDSSKTRLSILFYSIVGNALMLSKQSLRLLESFEKGFSLPTKETEFDLD